MLKYIFQNYCAIALAQFIVFFIGVHMDSGRITRSDDACIYGVVYVISFLLLLIIHGTVACLGLIPAFILECLPESIPNFIKLWSRKLLLIVMATPSFLIYGTIVGQLIETKH